MNTQSYILPKLTVIIINDNQSKGLLDSLESVISQKYANFECIIADNGSNADSIEVINNNLDNISYWFTEKCLDKYELVDKAVSKASGSYILLLNSGFYLCNDLVVQNLMENSNDCDFIYGNIVKHYVKGADNDKFETLKFDKQLTVDGIINHMPYLLFASLVKRELFAHNKFYDNSLRYVPEWAFVIKLFFLNKILFKYFDLNIVLVPVGRHGGIDKLSNIQLAVKEKQWFIRNRLPLLTGNLILNEISVNHSDMENSSGLIIKLASLIQNSLNRLSDYAKYQIRSARSFFELKYYKKRYGKQCFSIPIIINNKNHVTYLKRLILSLEKRGYKNIYIIDNASTYAPLLEFYKQTPYKVFLLKENVGFCALWDTKIFDIFKDQYYVYTDSDLEIVEECPDDFMVVMHYLINRYSLGKVGFSLPVDNLPSYYSHANEVKKWESKFNITKVERLAYMAMVDTTFALYRPNSFGDSGMLSAFRTAYPYSASHLPWYENSKELTPEQLYYYQNAKTSTHWSVKADAKSEMSE